MKLDPKGKKLAYVVIDMQNKFRVKHDDDALGHDFRVNRINEIARMFREAGRPVIFVKYIGGDECHPYEGEDGDEFFDGVEVLDSDIIYEKHHMNTFRESDFADVIRNLGCDGILLAGTVTQYCVLSTYFGAFDYDITPYMAQSATISTKEEYNNAVEAITKTLSPKDIRNYLDGKPIIIETSLHSQE